ncbi:MAG: hypothetical protein WD114_03240, partial [Phycisphaerales bacterium]
GTGMAIIAGDDESILPIHDNSGVIVVDRPNREDWALSIRQCLELPDKARDAGKAARDYITKHRRAAMHIEAVMEAYNKLCGIETPSEAQS